MSWYNILEAARRIGVGKGGPVPFTARMLADEAGIKQGKGKKATVHDIASAWLGKLYRWGYILPAGKTAPEEGRSETVYKLTDWGIRFKPKKGGRK